MTPKKPTTKDVEKSFYSNFMKRAQECFHAAQYSYKHQEWTAAAISAIYEGFVVFFSVDTPVIHGNAKLPCINSALY